MRPARLALAGLINNPNHLMEITDARDPVPDAEVTSKPKLQIFLCAPRGFCAGVVRAIDAVEQALRIYGAPVYVRHEIVHNKYVVEGLKAKGAIFVEELDEIPDTTAAGHLLRAWRAEVDPCRCRIPARFSRSTRPARW